MSKRFTSISTYNLDTSTQNPSTSNKLWIILVNLSTKQIYSYNRKTILRVTSKKLNSIYKKLSRVVDVFSRTSTTCLHCLLSLSYFA